MGKNRRYASTFNKQIRLGVKRTALQGIALMKAHGWALMEELHHRTPKGSGLLASSWRSGVDTPPTSVPKTVQFETKQQFYANVAKLKLTGVLWIANNQPYARRIEYGWGSKNPPSGFLRPALRSYHKRIPDRYKMR